MNYDLRFDICRKLHELEKGNGSPEDLKKEIPSSDEFSKKEISYLNQEIDRISTRKNKLLPSLSSSVEKYLPYALTFLAGYGVGYGTRWLQGKAEEWVREGEERGRSEALKSF